MTTRWTQKIASVIKTGKSRSIMAQDETVKLGARPSGYVDLVKIVIFTLRITESLSTI